LAPRLRAAHRNVSAALRPDVPPLTKELARGLSLAEDPGDGLSFGESRCAALARALDHPVPAAGGSLPESEAARGTLGVQSVGGRP
jgi:hypothetical protein